MVENEKRNGRARAQLSKLPGNGEAHGNPLHALGPAEAEKHQKPLWAVLLRPTTRILRRTPFSPPAAARARVGLRPLGEDEGKDGACCLVGC